MTHQQKLRRVHTLCMGTHLNMGRFQISVIPVGLVIVFALTIQNMLSVTSLLNDHALKLVPTIAREATVVPITHDDNAVHSQGINRRLCTREEIKDGSWFPVEATGPPYIPKNEHLRCYPEERYLQPPWRTFEWEPHEKQCHLSRFNTSDYCSLMQYGTVLIAGDSLSWEHYSSLGQLLGLRVRQSSQFISKDNRQNHVQFACNRQSRIVFRRDDLLTNLTAAIMDHFPVVVVLNRGAHYQNDTVLSSGIRRNIQEIKEWKAKCAAFGYRCHLFWRTSVPGHPLCDKVNFTVPINNIVEMENWISNVSNYDAYTSKYHWYDYQHQNELVLNLLRQGLGDDGFQVLDAYHLNVRRPDEHRVRQGDCLHNCYPGKMDVYNQLLLHYLRMERTQADADYMAKLFAQARATLLANGLLKDLDQDKNG